MESSTLGLLGFYCFLVLLASLAGGWIPIWVRLTHTRLQVATSGVAGLMLGVGLLHLVPHGFQELKSIDLTARWLMGGFLVMFFIQRFFHFHHHDVPEEAPESCAGDACCPGEAHGHAHAHDATLAERSAGHLSWGGAAIGLTIHSIMDGIALAASVVAHQEHKEALAGFGTFLVVILHKPFDAMAISTLLANTGWSRSRRHWINAFFALMVPVGVALFFGGLAGWQAEHGSVIGAVLVFSAGTFLCIAASDLLPELQFHTHDRGKLSAALVLGIGLAAAIGLFETTGHDHHNHSHGEAVQGQDHNHDHDHDHDHGAEDKKPAGVPAPKPAP